MLAPTRSHVPPLLVAFAENVTGVFGSVLVKEICRLNAPDPTGTVSFPKPAGILTTSSEVAETATVTGMAREVAPLPEL